MPRTAKPKLSPALRELLEEPVELDNPDDDPGIIAWNKLVEEYNAADPDVQNRMEHKMRMEAATVLYGGEDPRTIPVGDLLYMSKGCPSLFDVGISSTSARQRFMDRIKGPLTGVRAYCVDCQGGVPSLVRECAATSCAHWPFRMGNNPFFGKLHDAEASAEDEPAEKEPTDAH